MNRSKKVVIVAHCILNANSKVVGLASYPGAIRELTNAIVESGAGIVQLPCPELTFCGLKRWGKTREQYDHHAYKSHCAEILLPYVNQMQEYLLSGYVIERIIGVDGSPSCGVNRTCFGYGGGELDSPGARLQKSHEAPGTGVFMEILGRMLAENGCSIRFAGIDEMPK